MGRPSSLTAEVKNAIIASVGAGNYRETAAAAAGVHRTTLRNWEKRGETGEEPYAAFVTDLQAAEAQAEIDLLNEIRNGARVTVNDEETPDGRPGLRIVMKNKSEWQRLAWVMERRWPRRWGGRVRATVTEELGALIERLRAKVDDETFAKVVDATREDAPGVEPGQHH